MSSSFSDKNIRTHINLVNALMQMKESRIMLTGSRWASTTSRVDRIAHAILGGNEWVGIIKMCVWRDTVSRHDKVRTRLQSARRKKPHMSVTIRLPFYLFVRAWEDLLQWVRWKRTLPFEVLCWQWRLDNGFSVPCLIPPSPSGYFYIFLFLKYLKMIG